LENRHLARSGRQTATALGLAIAPSILLPTDEVIEKAAWALKPKAEHLQLVCLEVSLPGRLLGRLRPRDITTPRSSL